MIRSFFDYDPEKTVEALLYLGQKTEKFDEYKACKLLFFSDKLHLVRFGTTITGDDYSALEFGPIPSKTRNRIKGLLELGDEAELSVVFNLDKHFKYPRLIPKRASDLDFLSESDREVLDEIIELYGTKSFDHLKDITHLMPAYKKAWKVGDSKRSFPMAFVDFFEEDQDAIEGALELLRENLALRPLFGRIGAPHSRPLECLSEAVLIKSAL